jgi:Immunoglobulin I-set domain
MTFRVRLRPLMGRLNIPVAALATLLQRSPAVRVFFEAFEASSTPPLGSVVRSSVAAAATLGALDTLSGATTATIQASPVSPLSTTVGTPVSVAFVSTNSQVVSSWSLGASSAFPPGLVFSGGGSSPGITAAPGYVNVPNQYAVLTGTPTTVGTYWLAMQSWSGPNGTGAYSSSVYTYIIYVYPGSATAPTFSQNPVSLTVASGHTAVFSVAASGSPAPTLQWALNGTPISGATSPVLLVSDATSANAGTYTCVATNSAGSKTSSAATLTVAAATNPGRLTNLSARAFVNTGANILIAGFGTSGSGNKQLLLRAVGPGMGSTFGFPGYLPDAALQLYDNTSTLMATDHGWGAAPVKGTSSVTATVVDATAPLMASLGAFSLLAGSLDSAVLATVPNMAFTYEVLGQGASPTGVALAEIYDADSGVPPARLINIAARAQVGANSLVYLVGGFTIGENTAETVLIRGVGPGLTATFGLTGTLVSPVLTLFDSNQNVIATNTSWGTNPTLGSSTVAAGIAPSSVAVMNSVGAFSLASGSADCAILATLPPGGYTAQLSGASGGTGIGLVEVYEVP